MINSYVGYSILLFLLVCRFRMKLRKKYDIMVIVVLWKPNRAYPMSRCISQRTVLVTTWYARAISTSVLKKEHCKRNKTFVLTFVLKKELLTLLSCIQISIMDHVTACKLWRLPFFFHSQNELPSIGRLSSGRILPGSPLLSLYVKMPWRLRTFPFRWRWRHSTNLLLSENAEVVRLCWRENVVLSINHYIVHFSCIFLVWYIC